MQEFFSLDGAWKMRKCGEEEYIPVTVPGSVYSAYLDAGLMEDPFYRENELEAFELLKNDFEFTKAFEYEKKSGNRLILRAEGLDTIADVYLNDNLLGHADNMHIIWEWDATEALKSGGNELKIKFYSPINAALEADKKNPSWGSTDATPGFMHIRKAHCMYGWDWGARLPDAGIWRSIGIVSFDTARLDSVLIRQNHDGGNVTLNISPELSEDSDYEGLSYKVFVTAPDGRVLESKECALVDECAVTIENPSLWWPNGFGLQPLYSVKVVLLSEGRELDEWERRIGLRTLSVCTDSDEYGHQFCHIVNGVKIFAMGADYIPEDNVFSRITPDRTRRLLEDAKLANYNCVRVWGGGYYPDDFFYDICDELGLLVWQDLMYACAYYYLTDEFEKSISIEAFQNTRRLRHHASLALICGNNEMEEEQMGGFLSTLQNKWMPAMSEGEGFVPHEPKHHADYIKMYEYILPRIVKEQAPDTFWWPSSPSSGGNFDDPQDESRGDCHYWGVWHGEKPFMDYRNHFFRYLSEFGFQSFPSLPTVKSFTEENDRNIFSRIMERHQRNAAANGKIIAYLSQTYRYPLGFDNMLYCSQLLQAEAIRYGVEHYRRNRGRCMGCVVWQLNDNWPVASWSSIDYYGRWKALHYFEKRFFAPVMISCLERGEAEQKPKINEYYPKACDIEKSAHICVSNETVNTVKGEAKWYLIDPCGQIVKEGGKILEIPALSNAWLDKEVFADADVTRNAIFYTFSMDGEIVSYGSVLLCNPKHYEFADPALSVAVSSEENEVYITVNAGAYAKSVYIESDDPDMLLSDNYFDMLPGVKKITLLRGCADNLRVRSIYDMDKRIINE